MVIVWFLSIFSSMAVKTHKDETDDPYSMWNCVIVVVIRNLLRRHFCHYILHYQLYNLLTLKNINFLIWETGATSNTRINGQLSQLKISKTPARLIFTYENESENTVYFTDLKSEMNVKTMEWLSNDQVIHVCKNNYLVVMIESKHWATLDHFYTLITTL